MERKNCQNVFKAGIVWGSWEFIKIVLEKDKTEPLRWRSLINCVQNILFPKQADDVIIWKSELSVQAAAGGRVSRHHLQREEH
jgi:hypothetical protein